MSQKGQKSCACGGKTTLVFPCSGAADTGEIADRATRIFASRFYYNAKSTPENSNFT